MNGKSAFDHRMVHYLYGQPNHVTITVQILGTKMSGIHRNPDFERPGSQLCFNLWQGKIGMLRHSLTWEVIFFFFMELSGGVDFRGFGIGRS